MDTKENLVPFNAMTAELHRELSRRGGIASGRARRAKREEVARAKAELLAERDVCREIDESILRCVAAVKAADRAAKRAGWM